MDDTGGTAFAVLLLLAMPPDAAGLSNRAPPGGYLLLRSMGKQTGYAIVHRLVGYLLIRRSTGHSQ